MMAEIALVTFIKALVIAAYGVVTDWLEQRRLKRSPPE